MSREFKVLGLVLARGGSKGIPRKNLRDFCGRPLIYWTIKSGLESGQVDSLIVSTDDPEIAALSAEFGAQVPFLRPDHLASDSTPRNDVIAYHLELFKGYKYLMLLQPTSPLRQAFHIEEAMNLLLCSKAPACVSVAKQGLAPNWTFGINEYQRLKLLFSLPKTTNRQEQPSYYALNGSIYIIETEFFISSHYSDPFVTAHTAAYVMQQMYSLDLDEEWQWETGEFQAKNLHILK